MAGSTLVSPTASAKARAARGSSTSPWRETWRRFRRHKLAMVSLGVLAFLVVTVIVGPFLWRTSIDELDYGVILKGPSWAHPLGADDLGRDILARMLYGGRISLAVGLASMVVAILVGVVVGAIAGISRGWVDAALMWLTDLFLSLPQLPLLLLLLYLFSAPLKAIAGPEVGIFILIVIVIGGFRWMPAARLVRAQFFSLREKEFVEAARALGASVPRQVMRHILPNSLGVVIVAATIDVAAAIIAESTLSFLGFGFPPDIPSWGRILRDAQDTIDHAPHWVLAPGIAISLTVLAISFIGDGLRDALDPKEGDVAVALLGHLSFGVENLDRAARFYDAILAPLGYVRVWSNERGVGFGEQGGGDKLALFARPGQARAPGAGFHLAFDAPSRAAVDAFHAAAIAAGGTDQGAPGPRPHYGSTYYAAFVIDSDGYKLEAVHQ